MTRTRNFRVPRHPRHQRGVVLYVALILLILLTLLGIAGMQVSAMQERMSSGWRATNLAFQNSERTTKGREVDIATTVGIFSADDERCDPFDPGTWAEDLITLGDVDGAFVRRIDQCSPGGGIGMAQRPVSEDTNTQYQVAAYATDVTTTATDRTAEAVVDTIFIP